MYKCSKCGLAVIIIANEKPIKACLCNAPVIAEMNAVTQGQGGIKG